MPKYFLKGIISLIIIFVVSGCNATKDVHVRSYVQDKKRVDQDFEGNVGNWENAPEVTEPAGRKDTRRIYVLEFSKEPEPPVDEDVYTINTANTSSLDTFVEPIRDTKKGPTTTVPNIVLPKFDDEGGVPAKSAPPAPSAEKTVKYVDYKIEKDDTLQKISKKFYNSYSKWPKIYEANKQVLKNPDFIKPGIVIKIPMEQ